ncbi:unnamed protein product [Pleuronectes platessa]|uniref:DEAD/DEAH box helicase domain-containing protein n=1 Tax=Pleuronectes platessa TaxID=8262 RepID=A0A9N7UNJ5_PLEPL|nr:unnamed protein product [Pleuronectes platessa]
MPAAGELRCVDAAIESVLEDIDSALLLKEEQRNAIKPFVDRKDVFAILPTGFRKSLFYQLAPMVAKKMGHGNVAAIRHLPCSAGTRIRAGITTGRGLCDISQKLEFNTPCQRNEVICIHTLQMRLRSIRTKTARHKTSFFPAAVGLINKARDPHLILTFIPPPHLKDVLN